MAVQVRTGDWFWDAAGGPGSVHRDATVITFANTDATGVGFTSLLEGLIPGDVIHIDEKDNPNGWWVYNVSAAPVPGGGAPPVAATHLSVDNYSGGFVRVFTGPSDATTVDFRLATAPGPGGALYPNLAAIPDSSAVWVDFSGTLGKVKRANGADVLGTSLKDWITRGAVFEVTKDTSDPAHPNLVVGLEVLPPPPADTTAITVSAGGHGPNVAPNDGDEMLVTFMLMVGPDAPIIHIGPTLPELRQRLQLPESVVTDDELTDILASCRDAQDADCDTTTRTEALDLALIRRVGRDVAARSLPLGSQDTEYGQAYIPRWDPILQELEAPYLRGGFS